jgi:hypothetical protein
MCVHCKVLIQVKIAQTILVLDMPQKGALHATARNTKAVRHRDLNDPHRLFNHTSQPLQRDQKRCLSTAISTAPQLQNPKQADNSLLSCTVSELRKGLFLCQESRTGRGINKCTEQGSI